MLLPIEAAAAWAALAVVPAWAVWRNWRSATIWCGLALAAGGAVYYPAVMANRPHNYYAILEFLASAGAVAIGLLTAVVGAIWAYGGSTPTEPPASTGGE